MLEEFKINKILGWEKYGLTNSKLKVQQKTGLKYLEYEIPIENIGYDMVISETVNRPLFGYAFLAFLCGSVINSAAGAVNYLVILTGLSLLLLILGFVLKLRTITIPCSLEGSIVLKYRKSNKSKTLEFSKQIIEQSKKYTLNKFGKIDKDLPLEGQLENLLYLKNINLLDNVQFEELKTELIKLKSKDGKSNLGF